MPVTSIATTVPGRFDAAVNPKGLDYMPPSAGIESSGIDLILSVVALAMLAPVLIFIATATRLSAARREQRFAAMRLVGATRKQVSLLAATESTAAAVLGVAAGFGIFFLLRAPVAGIPFLGEPFFPADISLSLPDILAVAIGVPVAAAVAARLALRRVHISPLGVARRTTPRPPRAWRVLPLLAGLAELGFFVVHGTPASPGGEVWALMPGFLLIIVGLVIAGPWLTMAAARVMARRTGRPGALIAARRLADDPRAAFRAVSGLVLALFITTVAVVGIATQDAKDLTRFATPAAAAVVTDQLAASGGFTSAQEPAESGAGPAAPAAPLAAQLRGIPGVLGVVVVRAVPKLTIPGAFHNLGTGPGVLPSPVPAGVVSCAQLATVPALGRCPAGATAAAFPEDGFDGPLDGTTSAGITWPAVNVPAARLDTLAVDAINVGTNGSVPAIEQARTVLENAHAYFAPSAPSTLGDLIRQDHSGDDAYRQLANTVILVSLPIAGCTLAAAIAAGLADRKRPFSLLRLAGARLAIAAPCRRAGKRRPAARRRRRRDRHRVRRLRGVRLRRAALPHGGARRRVLPHHRGRDPGGPGHHRGHLPAAGPHHRTRRREKRISGAAQVPDQENTRRPRSRLTVPAQDPERGGDLLPARPTRQQDVQERPGLERNRGIPALIRPRLSRSCSEPGKP